MLLSKFYFVCFFILYEILSVFIDNTTFIFIYIKEFVIEKTKAMSTIEKIVNYTLIWGALGLLQKFTVWDINEASAFSQNLYAWIFVPLNLIGIYIGIRYVFPYFLRLAFVGSEKTSSEFLETENSERDNSNKKLEDKKRKEAINKLKNKIQESNASPKKKEMVVEKKIILKTVDAAKVNTYNNKL